MSLVTMALGAFDLLIENVFCMIPGFADIRGLGELFVLFPVASEAESRWYDYLAMTRRY
jgi:hypothetical protein